MKQLQPPGHRGQLARISMRSPGLATLRGPEAGKVVSKEMNGAHDGHSIDRERAPQIYEMEADSAARYFNFQGWKLPEGSRAKNVGHEATLALDTNLAFQAHRLLEPVRAGFTN